MLFLAHPSLPLAFLLCSRWSLWDRLGPGTWDPLLQGLHLDKRLLEQQNTKELWGTKNNCVHVQSGQIMNSKIQKGQNATVTSPLVRCQEQKHGTTRDPCTQHREGGGQTSSATPPAPTHWSAHLTPFKLTPRPPGMEQGYAFLAFAPSCCSTSPSKDLSESLIGPLTNFYWLKSPRGR